MVIVINQNETYSNNMLETFAKKQCKKKFRMIWIRLLQNLSLQRLEVYLSCLLLSTSAAFLSFVQFVKLSCRFLFQYSDRPQSYAIIYLFIYLFIELKSKFNCGGKMIQT